jgi:hypothetical protein
MLLRKKFYMAGISFVFIFILSLTKPWTVKADSTYITTQQFIKKLVEATKLDVDQTKSQPYISAALAGGIVVEGEFKDYDSTITKVDAVVLVNRADEILNGTTFDETLFNQVKDKKRISDLNKVVSSKQDEVIKIFAKGIMVGASDGTYSHTRSFKGQDKLKLNEANTVVDRLVYKEKRKKISPDGQLIRTTKLPKNYKDYPYILAAFPNGFYEKRYRWADEAIVPVDVLKTNINGHKATDVMDAYLNIWTKKVETNLLRRLNMNYKTVNPDWINALANTYYVFQSEDLAYMNKRQVDDIKNFLKLVKKNKLVIKGSCSVEPSSLYKSVSGFQMRCYIKFKVTSADNMKLNQEVMYDSGIYLKDLKKGKWYSMYVDIGIGTSNGSSNGEDYAVFDDYFK